MRSKKGMVVALFCISLTFFTLAALELNHKELKDKIIKQYKKNFGHELRYFAEMESFANQYSEYKLYKKNTDILLEIAKERFRGWQCIQIYSDDANMLRHEVLELFSKTDIFAFSLGSKSGKTDQHPQGITAVAVFLFSNKYYHYQDKDILTMILETLNKIREKQELKPLILNKALNQKAKKLADSYYKFNLMRPLRSPYYSAFYYTQDPNQCPTYMADMIIKVRNLNPEVGIGFIRPLNKSQMGNYFFIAIYTNTRR